MEEKTDDPVRLILVESDGEGRTCRSYLDGEVIVQEESSPGRSSPDNQTLKIQWNQPVCSASWFKFRGHPVLVMGNCLGEILALELDVVDHNTQRLRRAEKSLVGRDEVMAIAGTAVEDQMVVLAGYYDGRVLHFLGPSLTELRPVACRYIGTSPPLVDAKTGFSAPAVTFIRCFDGIAAVGRADGQVELLHLSLAPPEAGPEHHLDVTLVQRLCSPAPVISAALVPLTLPQTQPLFAWGVPRNAAAPPPASPSKCPLALAACCPGNVVLWAWPEGTAGLAAVGDARKQSGADNPDPPLPECVQGIVRGPGLVFTRVRVCEQTQLILYGDELGQLYAAPLATLLQEPEIACPAKSQAKKLMSFPVGMVGEPDAVAVFDHHNWLVRYRNMN
eukprot:gnl/Trimastix_PCT/3913.p1 GENE.gnl/Trimastix_PCT/3913~~gnl/Trimastix_PCT/3913.p1  ORF type:complete len:422 (-),score=115.91 gnl/Trimastix_PCT/3913:26-1195(-)